MTIKSMENQDFIIFCYQQVLRRDPEVSAVQSFVKELESQTLSREDFLIQLLVSTEFQENSASTEFVSPGHFYSVIPSLEEREAFISSPEASIDKMSSINLNLEGQHKLLEQFVSYSNECPFPINKTEKFRYHFNNPAYSFGDGIILYNILRHYKPKKVIEVGSGFSSCVTLDTNTHFFNDSIELTFIEPYPELLESLIADSFISNNKGKPQIIAKRLQDVDLSVFEQLQANDILFIDSTHVSKLNSDVNRIFFDILPSLSPGVIIHFHDIFWPFEYPKAWIQEGRAWNEAYMLRTFLEFNESFEILLFADYLGKHHKEWFETNMPIFLHNPGGNIWLRKTK